MVEEGDVTENTDARSEPSLRDRKDSFAPASPSGSVCMTIKGSCWMSHTSAKSVAHCLTPARAAKRAASRAPHAGTALKQQTAGRGRGQRTVGGLSTGQQRAARFLGRLLEALPRSLEAGSFPQTKGPQTKPFWRGTSSPKPFHNNNRFYYGYRGEFSLITSSVHHMLRDSTEGVQDVFMVEEGDVTSPWPPTLPLPRAFLSSNGSTSTSCPFSAPNLS